MTLVAAAWLILATPAGAQTQISDNRSGDTLSGARSLAVAPGPSGELLAAWVGGFGNDADPLNLRARRVDRAGAPIGPVVRFASASPSLRGDPAVAYSPRTRQYMVVWREQRIWGQRLDRRGRPVGRRFAVSSRLHPGRASDAWAGAPAVGWSSSARRWLVAWTGRRATDGASRMDVFTRSLGPRGERRGNRVRRVSREGPKSHAGRVALDYDARRQRYVVAWAGVRRGGEESVLFARLVRADGRGVGRAQAVARTGIEGSYILADPAIAGDGRGSRVVTWRWPSSAGVRGDDFSAIYGARLGSNAKLRGRRRRLSVAIHNENHLDNSAVAYNARTRRYSAAWRFSESAPVNRCDASDHLLLRTVSAGGLPVGPVRDAQIQTPSETGPCPVFISGAALAPGPGAGTLLFWSGATDREAQQVWSRPAGT